MTIRVALQFLLALTYLIVPLAGHRYGFAAQRAADAEIRRQGHDLAVLVKHGLDFTASHASVVVSVAIAVGLATLAVLNLGDQAAAHLDPPAHPADRRRPQRPFPARRGQNILAVRAAPQCRD
ncbi:hypothetical protein ABGB18_40190 [Nonomuraea sp. B12E4]|uniref:hypothetical protein n=1 Tax=Nonomuraea sp. B12E4 TaxID=3153564 RepID=UPI00325D3F58